MRIKIRGGRILILSMLPRRLAVIAGCMLPVLSAADWPAYRGPGASGGGQGAAPASWNGDTSTAPVRTITRRTSIHGLSHSSTVINAILLLVKQAKTTTGETTV